MNTHDTEVDPKVTWRSFLYVSVPLVLWSSSFPVVRFGLFSTQNPGGFQPGSLALLRFLIASAAALIYLVAARKPMPRTQDLLGLLLTGFVGISLYHFLFNYGEQQVASGAAAALVAASPVFVALFSVAFFKERLSVWGWLGVALSCSGVLIIGFMDIEGLVFDRYALALVGSAFSTALFFVLSKRFLKIYSGLQFTSYVFIAGAIPLLFFAPALGADMQHASGSALAAVVYLGLFPGLVGYAYWNKALSIMTATRLSVFLCLSPLIAAFIAWLWLGEIPTTLTVVGGIVAIAGVLIVQLRGEKQPE